MTVLIVDDDRFMVGLIKQYIKAGISSQTLEAYNGKQALELLALHTTVDLVLTDLHMPDIDGRMLANTLKSNSLYKHIPIILMTSDQTITESFTLNSQFRVFNDILPKPFTLDEMLTKINKLLSKNYSCI